jgi:hypothetical protein
MKYHENVDTTYPKINYKLQLLTRQTTRDMAHTKTPNGSNSESRWGARNLSHPEDHKKAGTHPEPIPIKKDDFAKCY